MGAVRSIHPQSNDGIGGTVIPIAAGLSAAAAAGLGAKAYMDRKKNNDNGDDDFDTEEWNEDSSTIEGYDESSDTSTSVELDADDEYGNYNTEQYGARNNQELADLQ